MDGWMDGWMDKQLGLMHLGLNRRALCAPYRIMGAVALRLKTLMTSWSNKGTQIYYFFSLKSPSKRTPLQVPHWGPYGERYSSTGQLRISKKPNKNPSNKKAPKKKRPSIFPKSGAAFLKFHNYLLGHDIINLETPGLQ